MVKKEQIEKVMKDIETADKLRPRIEELELILGGCCVRDLEVSLHLSYNKDGARAIRSISLTEKLRADFLRSVKDYYSAELREIEYRLGSLPEFENYD